MDIFINFFIIIHRSAVRIREAPPINSMKSIGYKASRFHQRRQSIEFRTYVLWTWNPHALASCGFFVGPETRTSFPPRPYHPPPQQKPVRYSHDKGRHWRNSGQTKQDDPGTATRGDGADVTRTQWCTRTDSCGCTAAWLDRRTHHICGTAQCQNLHRCIRV